MLLRKLALITFLSIHFNHNISVALEIEVSDQEYLNQFKRVFDRVNKDYVKETNRQEMIDAAISGMLTSLDPHSSYFTEEDLQDFLTQTKGEFGGIGVEVVNDNGVIKIISPIDDLPADKAGIKAGDYIVGVNDELVVNLGFNKSIKEMRGDAGTKVKLLVLRDGENKPKEIELIREIVKIKPIKSQMEPENIAYVRVATFNKNTMEELKKAFKNLAEHPGGIQGIILDVRNNPGGLLDQAVAVTDYFLDSGTVVSTKGKNSPEVILAANKFSAKAPKVPMIVLINSGSASASEIVAGALQDHKRALIVGTTSFGKGSVQTFIDISQRSALKITTAKYYTPNGRSIQAEGIEPDIIVEPAKIEYAEKDPLDKRFSEASLKNYIKNDSGKNKEDSISVEKNDKKSSNNKEDKKTKLEKKLSDFYKKDYQFARAYDLIKALIVSKTKF